MVNSCLLVEAGIAPETESEKQKSRSDYWPDRLFQFTNRLGCIYEYALLCARGDLNPHVHKDTGT